MLRPSASLLLTWEGAKCYPREEVQGRTGPSQDLTATVSTLAHLARFIIADLTDPNSIPYELATVVPTNPVPVQPILLSGKREFPMFVNLQQRYDWVLPTYRYEALDPLLASLADKVIAPAEAKVKALEEKRRMIEAELTKPQ
jgi:hypothetical protein